MLKENKKYEILMDEKNTIEFEGRVLHRIRALKNFGLVEIGEIGGYVQTEDNLSQYGNCWIYDDAKCMDNAKCTDNSVMYWNSCMYDNSRMFNNSKMYDNTKMFDNSRMFNNSKMSDNTKMFDNAMMYGNSAMYNNSQMFNDSNMFNNTKMYDNSKMYGNSQMRDESMMCDKSMMCDDSRMYDNAMLKNNDKLYGKINKSFKQIFQHQCRNRYLTAILTEENEILYSIGCQVGITKEVFIDRIYNDCEIEGNGLVKCPYRQEYLDMIDTIEYHFEKFKN